MQYIGAPKRSLILAHEVWRVLNRFSLFHAVASLFVRFRLGLLEWVFPGFSHTTIPKVQKCGPFVAPFSVACFWPGYFEEVAFRGFPNGFQRWKSMSCRSRKILQNEYLVAKIGFDDADNEPLKVCW